ncbi:traB domain-containing protein isoform X2 [Vigna radiata var. radiata]|uniref:TraB domain-containing protein isoform X2 n=1 Tax=Vigna radiata var. radiata TaxID=3916 RepID=A0A3Q0ER58_VIGRR|nr:traB domain-containing protein isoform X2 [Vigna radiata var. radiata]
MFQRLMGYLVTRNRTRTLNQLARVTPFIHRHKSLLAAPFSCSQTLSSLQFSTDTSAFTQHPVRLPDDLSKNLIVLSSESSAEGGVCHVYLVGTSHVSQESSRQVQAIVKFLKPQAVFLELCRSRASILTRKNIHEPTVKEMVTQLGKKQNIIEVLFRWFYAKVGSELGVLPGNEFRVAYEEAIKYGGKVILGDRPQQITNRRTWSMMPLWYIPKFLYFSLSFEQHFPISGDFVKMLKEIEDRGMLPLIMQKMNEEFPILMETLVHERDRFMSARLLNVARTNSSVVAVVGKGHLQGIKKHWKQPVVVGEHLVICII